MIACVPDFDSSRDILFECSDIKYEQTIVIVTSLSCHRRNGIEGLLT